MHNNIQRHPASPGAMTVRDIAHGVRFRSYEPHDVSSVRVGRFTSDPYEGSMEEQLVAIELDDGTQRDVELCSLGITPNTSGEWSTRPTVPDTVE